MVSLTTLIHQLPSENVNRLCLPNNKIDVSEIMIMASPDISNWIIPGELILTSFFGLRPSQQQELVEELSRYQSSGIMVKRNNFLHEVSPELVQHCKKLQMPLLEIQDITYRQIIDTFTSLKNSHINSRNKFLDSHLESSLLVIIKNTYTDHDILTIKSALGITDRDMVKIASLSTSNLSTQQFKRIVSKVKTIIPKSVFGFFEGHFIIAFQNADDLMMKLNKLAMDLPTIQFAVGPSEPLLDIQKSYEQTTRILKLIQAAKIHTRVVNYDQLGIDKLFLTIPSNILEASLDTSNLETLQKQNPELFDSLLAYFQTKQNITQAAKLLFIHPKSLAYRLHKIEKILSINLSNPDEALSLNLASRFVQLRRENFFV